MSSVQPEAVGEDVPVPRPLPKAPPRYTKSSLRLLLARDLRWAFSPPYAWMSGVAANLLLAAGYLLIAPLTGRPRQDFAVLIGSYFAVWVLADVTTTNVIGTDTIRIRLHLLRGTPLVKILLSKNLVLLIVIGIPTLIGTGIVTVVSEQNFRLLVTLPAVLFPILTWIGAGNVVSVCLPVDYLTWRRRWGERFNRRRTMRWLLCLALPYAAYVVVNPTVSLPRLISQNLTLPRGLQFRGLTLLVTGIVLWGLCTAAAIIVARTRKLRFDDLR